MTSQHTRHEAATGRRAADVAAAAVSPAPVEVARANGDKPATKAGRRGFRIADSDRWLGVTMLGPAIVYILAFVGVPFVVAILLSFSDATVGDPSIDNFVGLANYIEVVQQPNFRTALINSVLITFISLAVLIVLSTILAELLVPDFRFKKVIQTLIILPWAMPVALAAVTWLWLLNAQFSPIDWIFRQIGILGPGGLFGPAWHFFYLGRTGLALASIIALNVWRLLPLTVIIVLAGRISIPRERFEQAEIDGAGLFRKLFSITIPALMPTLAVAILLGGLLIFGNEAIVALLTHGQPGNETVIIPFWAYMQGIRGGDLASGAAVALFMLPVLLAVSILVLRFAGRSGADE